MSFKYNREHMRKTLDFIKPNSVCVEVGVWKGEFSEQILKKDVKSLYLIDPWVSIADFPERWHAVPQDEMDLIYNNVVSKFSEDTRVKIIKEFSAQAASSFEDNSVDWVYVDGNHSYEFVKEDLNVWWPKISEGGAICGDDYMEGKYQTDKLDFGVVKAVDEFVNLNVDSITNFQLFKDQFVIQK